MCWLFPGKLVKLESVCADCNEPIIVEMRDGEILSLSPEEAVTHHNSGRDRSWTER